MHLRALLAALVLAAVAIFVGVGNAADTQKRWFDGSLIQVHTSTTYVDVSAATYTSATVLLTMAPPSGNAAHDVSVTIDLDKATTGFNDGYSSETIQFLVGRRVDGSNWRVDAQNSTTAISGTNANTRSVTLNVGTVTPDEGLRIYVILSAEQGDVALPYVVTYRAPLRMTFTDVSN